MTDSRRSGASARVSVLVIRLSATLRPSMFSACIVRLYRVFGVISGKSVPSISAMQPSLQSRPSRPTYSSPPAANLIISLYPMMSTLRLSAGMLHETLKPRDKTAVTSRLVGVLA